MKVDKKEVFLNTTDPIKLTLESDVFDSQKLDTKVTIEGGILCWVYGEERDKFVEELNALLEKHRI